MDYSQVGGEGVTADGNPRLLVHLDDEEGKGLIALILAPAQKDLPELFPVNGVIRLLEVDEGRVVASLLALLGVDLD